MKKIKVLIAGLAGASLGTELTKSLAKFEDYELYGCDISELAYGLHMDVFKSVFLADRDRYIDSIIDFCTKNDITYVLPGGEQPTILLSRGSEKLTENCIVLLGNSAEIIGLFSDKTATFKKLHELGVPIPWTKEITAGGNPEPLSLPCIVKPARDTGGSDSVFIASTKEECNLYVELLRSNGKIPVLQEYINLDEGEFTIGVLSGTKGNIIGSIAMKRVFNSKLSVAYKGEKGLISSGYSQGLIADFKDLRTQAEEIAKKAGSVGPLNIQGRVREGIMIPFEINPRFSASTFLRSMAGFDEVDFFIRNIEYGTDNFDWKLREGYYMRTFDQVFIPETKQ